MRWWLFVPRLRFKSYEEMNSWLLDRCVVDTKTQRHPGGHSDGLIDARRRRRRVLGMYTHPVEPFDQSAELRWRQPYRAILDLRPAEASILERLGEQAQPRSSRPASVGRHASP